MAVEHNRISAQCAAEAAHGQSVHTVAVDSYVTDTNTWNLYNNQVKYAELGAKWLFDQLGGKGTVYYMRGLAGHPADSDRDIGFNNMLKKYPDIKVANPGGTFTEIYQNCNVFNDDAFIALTGKDTKGTNQIRLQHGKPVVFGPQGERCVAVEFDGTLRIADTADVPPELIYVHDAHRQDPSTAFALAHLSKGPTEPTAIGVFRDVARPVYGDLMDKQIATATERLGKGDLAKLLLSGDTWEVT